MSNSERIVGVAFASIAYAAMFSYVLYIRTGDEATSVGTALTFTPFAIAPLFVLLFRPTTGRIRFYSVALLICISPFSNLFFLAALITAIFPSKNTEAISHSLYSDYYNTVATELAQGEPLPGLWARAFAESDGVLSKTRALYMRLRAEQLFLEASNAATTVVSLIEIERRKKMLSRRMTVCKVVGYSTCVILYLLIKLDAFKKGGVIINLIDNCINTFNLPFISTNSEWIAIVTSWLIPLFCFIIYIFASYSLGRLEPKSNTDASEAK